MLLTINSFKLQVKSAFSSGRRCHDEGVTDEVSFNANGLNPIFPFFARLKFKRTEKAKIFLETTALGKKRGDRLATKAVTRYQLFIIVF